MDDILYFQNERAPIFNYVDGPWFMDVIYPTHGSTQENSIAMFITRQLYTSDLQLDNVLPPDYVDDTFRFTNVHLFLYHDISPKERYMIIEVGWIDYPADEWRAYHKVYERGFWIKPMSSNTSAIIPVTVIVGPAQSFATVVRSKDGDVNFFWGNTNHPSKIFYNGKAPFAGEPIPELSMTNLGYVVFSV
ncbi:hypothetical protein, partial [[Eubacterium] cellulosolvens]